MQSVPEATEEENQVLARLLGPRGELLSVLLERPVVECGYTPAPKVPTRIRRPVG